jgi:cell wall assembly regulator SMI1
MMIENNGPQVNADDIKALEVELGATLPAAYREFLMAYNGGSPTPDTIDVPGASGTPTDVQVFFGIGRSAATSDLRWNLTLVRERCNDRDLLPIACDSGGSIFCFKLENGAASAVVYCDFGTPECRLYPVAPNFSDFVASLRSFGH